MPITQAKTLLVFEIYRSIQGESSFAGTPCTLVRLSSCNLRCRWCDTPQAFVGGTRMALEEVLSEALALQTPMVLVTGGEPLLQDPCHDLLTALCDAGKIVLLETSGERDISRVDPRVHRIVDFKAPGSGECDSNRFENIAALTRNDEVKLVLADAADYAWAKNLIAAHALHERAAHVLLSPVHGELDPQELVAWVLEDQLPVRVQLQLHKYIWGVDAKSV